ncbi:MAG: radical SAM protein, partial [Candidatus Omnitrophica bacterium]|nr:radical SAM protein [Candidatus Omnitrophota bacterium]
KILLINPPPRHICDEPIVVPPLGLGYLAAVARKAGHDVCILDAFAEQLTWEAFSARVAPSRYDIIALSGMTPVFDTVQKALQICRSHTDWLILGGPHATVFADTVLRENPCLDAAVFGEGEETWAELLSALDSGGIFSAIPGVITREWKGAARQWVENLDALPFPARDLLPNEKYRYPLCGGRRITTISSSRGCPYQCVFCDKSIFGSHWRARSAANVLEEIDEVVMRFGVQSIIFYDDLFTLNKDRLAAICEGLIERNYNLFWKAEGRVDTVDAECLQLMKRAGCDSLAYGVESGNQHGLDWIGKKTTPDMARRAFRLTREAGIKTLGYFILGIPVETYNDALRTIKFAIELKTDYAQFSILSPLPGSRLYIMAKDEGWYSEIKAHNVFDKDLKRPVLITKNWDEAKLSAIIQEAHRRFYMRPSYWFRTLLSIRTWGEAQTICRSGKKMMKYIIGFLWRAP